MDNEVGAAGATGRGEDVIKACSSFYIVSRMREGRSPQEACEDALRRIDERYAAVGIDYRPGEKFVAINKDGEFGCAWNIGDRRPAMSEPSGAVTTGASLSNRVSKGVMTAMLTGSAG